MSDRSGNPANSARPATSTSSRTRTCFAAALVVTAALASPVAARDLFVAGTVGEVYRGDSETGAFEPWAGICLAPVRALAMDDEMIYAGDLAGGVVRFDRDTGDFEGVFFLPGSITAMLVDGDDLLVSNVASTIRRVNPATGAVLATLTTPNPVEAMFLIGSDLYISGPVGGVFKGDAVLGGFEYFACACQGPVTAMVRGDGVLYVGDAWGQVMTYSLATGFPVAANWIAPAITSLSRDGDIVLAGDDSNQVHRLDGGTLLEIDVLASPIDVEAMLIQPTCDSDLDGDAQTGFSDLAALLLDWGACAPPCAADIDGNGVVGFNDLTQLLISWGACSPG